MPLDLTGIQNVGEFYSHHYLDALLENDLKGLLARWREEDEQTPDRRLARVANDFFAAKSRALRETNAAERYTESHRVHVELLEALGYEYAFEVEYLVDGAAIPVLSAVKRDGRDYIWLVETVFTGADEAPLDMPMLRAQYPHSTQEIELPEGTWQDILGDIFHRDEPPRWVILFAGRLVYLLDRTKWGYGQYLLFDLDEIFGRRQTQTLRAVAALLAREALCPDEGVPLHDTLDENSHKHAYGVSTDLKYGVRRAVELLANEYVWYQRNVGKQALFQDDALAKKLTREALTYLYRLLFLFYAEARGGELDVVPMKSDAFRLGYSLESLRDLEQVPLTTPQAQDGYFIHESIKRLFELVNDGYQPQQLQLMHDDAPPVYDDYGFRMNGVHSPLFDPASTPLLAKAKFRNAILQEVIQLLSLSREKKGKAKRGRISYAQLGINQLGAVYEGLLSYTGFFAQEKLYEVKPADAQAADETAQTYFIPESEIARYEADEFVYTESADGSRVRKTYPKGSFIFRLAGRDREKLASYYTPEVLTQCVVKYSLKELLRDKSADEILQLVFCEMALGSGAFANEMLNQLADAYLERKQKEINTRIAPDDYREERQKVKAYLAAHNLYGVDLNPTAIELARVSIWLNIIYRDAPAPWFGARLAVGNSLIGARHQVYAAQDILSGAYQNQAPTPIHLNEPRPAGSVYHWLLPDAGMAAFDSDKVIKELAPDEVSHLKTWRKEFTKKITAEELKNLQALSDRADALWAQHVSQRQALLERTRTKIDVWGQTGDGLQTTNKNLSSGDVNAKDKELEQLYHPTSSFRRLKMAMDYWCALWFWRIPEAKQLPTRQQFWNDIADLFVGVESEFVKPPEQMTLLEEMAATKQAHFADLKPANVDDLCRSNARLKLAADVTEQIRFHHWELVFAEVFAVRGGFDLITGNPPWVKVRWNEGGILSDFDPFLQIRKINAADIAQFHRGNLLKLQTRRDEYFDEFVEQVGTKSVLSTVQLYQILKSVQTNLYKSFIALGWAISNTGGVSGLVHDYGMYDDPEGYEFRRACYQRLSWAFRFYNQLNLFPEESLGHAGQYCVSIFVNHIDAKVNINLVANLFHPRTIDDSVGHDGMGTVTGMKTEFGEWELRGHQSRIVPLTENDLKLFATLYEESGTDALSECVNRFETTFAKIY